MAKASLTARLLGVEKTVVEDVWYDEEEGALVASVRPYKNEQGRCGICGTSSPMYDRGEGVRRWRTLDLGTVKAYLEGEAPRVQCPFHGVVVAAVPWARHKARFTKTFDDQVAWLATQTSKSAACELMRVSWRTVGRIVTRVGDEARAQEDVLSRLKRIGIDEISYRRGHRYLTVVVDHDKKRLVWAAPGRDKATLHRFFEELGPERSEAIEEVSSDAGNWIAPVVAERCPNAELCMDPFHVVQWATKALDEVRREVWRMTRQAGMKALSKEVQRARFALWKNPEDLTEHQAATLATIQKANRPLYRAYLLKEQLRQVFRARGRAGIELLDGWLKWASRSRLEPFVELGRKIRRHLQAVHAVLIRGLSNALVESINTRIRLAARRAFGFHSPEALIALAMLDVGGLCPPLPGRLQVRVAA